MGGLTERVMLLVWCVLHVLTWLLAVLNQVGYYAVIEMSGLTVNVICFWDQTTLYIIVYRYLKLQNSTVSNKQHVRKGEIAISPASKVGFFTIT